MSWLSKKVIYFRSPTGTRIHGEHGVDREKPAFGAMAERVADRHAHREIEDRHAGVVRKIEGLGVSGVAIDPLAEHEEIGLVGVHLALVNSCQNQRGMCLTVSTRSASTPLSSQAFIALIT